MWWKGKDKLRYGRDKSCRENKERKMKVGDNGGEKATEEYQSSVEDTCIKTQMELNTKWQSYLRPEDCTMLDALQSQSHLK